MPTFCYHASHEQFGPRELIAASCLAESCGFDAVFCSDHLQPWSQAQGHSAHTWSWLGAALQATRRVSFSTITVPGGWRHHPVVLAQAIGTLCELFPGRLPWIALGSGEALNEAAVCRRWPQKAQRNARLLAGADMLRRLLRGETLTQQSPIEACEARIWVGLRQSPLLFGAAMTEDTARWMGAWTDGLLALGRDLERLARIVEAFRAGGGQGKPVHVKLDTCLGDDRAAALAEAHGRWRYACVALDRHHDLSSPQAFELESRSIRIQDMERHVLAWSDPAELAAHLRACVALGVESVNLHQVGADQGRFIRVVGADVLPALRQPAGSAAPG